MTESVTENSHEKHHIYMIVTYIFMILFPLVSVILCYIRRKETIGTIYYNHIQYLLRTFWGGVIAFILSFFIIPMLSLAVYSESFGLGAILIGVFSLFAITFSIWYLIRIIYGFIKVLTKESVKEKTWLI